MTQPADYVGLLGGNRGIFIFGPPGTGSPSLAFSLTFSLTHFVFQGKTKMIESLVNQLTALNKEVWKITVRNQTRTLLDLVLTFLCLVWWFMENCLCRRRSSTFKVLIPTCQPRRIARTQLEASGAHVRRRWAHFPISWQTKGRTHPTIDDYCSQWSALLHFFFFLPLKGRTKTQGNRSLLKRDSDQFWLPISLLTLILPFEEELEINFACVCQHLKSVLKSYASMAPTVPPPPVPF